MSSAALSAGTSANRQWRLAARPKGLPVATDWAFRTEPVPEPGEGQFLVRVMYISLDPAMRGWMNDARSYVPPVGIGEVMRAGGVGRVVASRHPDFAVGNHVRGVFGAQDSPITAGAGGQVVGQIAKIRGCRVVGIAGGEEKCRFIVDDLGFDAAVDYKNEDVRAALRERCPDRVNVYFDNVGGEILDTVLTRLARHARIVICGSISQYNNEGPARGPANYMALLVDRARMEGFPVFDYAKRYPEAAKEMAGWMAEGRLKSVEDMVTGMEQFPATLLRLYSGANFGKLILSVAGDAG